MGAEAGGQGGAGEGAVMNWINRAVQWLIDVVDYVIAIIEDAFGGPKGGNGGDVPLGIGA